MFFKVLAAIVTADAFDRHLRQQQHRAWIAQDERLSARAPAEDSEQDINDTSSWPMHAPERPVSSRPR